MNAWTVIALIALGSYALRAVMLVLVTAKPFPPGVQQAMTLVGPAAVGALFATLAFSTTASAGSLPLAPVAALVVAFVVVRRTGNILHGVALGFPILWALSFAGL